MCIETAIIWQWHEIKQSLGGHFQFQKLKFLDFSGFVKNYSFAMSSAIQMVGVLIVQGTFFLVMHIKLPEMQFKQLKLLANWNKETLPFYGFVSLSE